MQVDDGGGTSTTTDATIGASSDGGDHPASSSGIDATTVGQDDTIADGATTGEQLVCGLEEADASLEAWQTLQESASSVYYYIGQRFLSGNRPFTVSGCEYRTLIVVENGSVARREMYDGIPFSDERCAPGWVEEDGDLGTHVSREDGLPAPVWTLDEVYSSCCGMLSNVRDGAEGKFFSHEDGLLQRCFVQDLSCGDCGGVAPPEWGDEIRVVEIGIGPPPR